MAFNPDQYGRPSTPTQEQLNLDDDSQETYTKPRSNKGRRRVIGAVAAGAAAAVAAGVFAFGGGNSSAEHQPDKRPTASAPANPSQNHEASPSPSETENHEKMTVAEAEQAFNQTVEQNSERYETVSIEFEEGSGTALNYLDALSDWTMAGTEHANYEAWSDWMDASLEPGVSNEEFNSVPNLQQASERIAGTVAEHYTKNPLFENLTPETVELLTHANAVNIQLSFERLADREKYDQQNVDYEAHLNAEAITEPSNVTEDTNVHLQFAIESNDPDGRLVDAFGNGTEYPNTQLHMAFNSETQTVESARIDALSAPSVYEKVNGQ